MAVENVINRITTAFQSTTAGLPVTLNALATVEGRTITMPIPGEFDYYNEFPVEAQVSFPFVVTICERTEILFDDVNAYERHLHAVTAGYFATGLDRYSLMRLAQRAGRAMEKVILKQGVVESYSDANVAIIMVEPRGFRYSLSTTKEIWNGPEDLVGGCLFDFVAHERILHP